MEVTFCFAQSDNVILSVFMSVVLNASVEGLGVNKGKLGAYIGIWEVARTGTEVAVA